MIADTGLLVPGQTRVQSDSPLLANLGYVGVVDVLDPARPDLIHVRCDGGLELWTSTAHWSITASRRSPVQARHRHNRPAVTQGRRSHATGGTR